MYKKEIDPTAKKEASAKIAEKLKQIEALYDECAAIGEEFEVSFSYSGPAGYGDGGWYTPKAEVMQDHDEEWEPSDESYGWQTSSSSC